MEIELERTYLVRQLPSEVNATEPVEIFDIYFPPDNPHPTLRIRKKGNRHEMTKKTCLNGTDSSQQQEDTITLSEAEFNALAQAKGKQLRKHRHTYRDGNVTVDIDVFLDDLAGLVLVDFEFVSVEEKNAFVPPSWCLVEVTQDEAIAGGKLAGRSYADIQAVLARYGYEKLCD